MESHKSSVLKVVIFFLIGLLFVIGMITYSNARTDRDGKFVEDEEWMPRSSDETHKQIEKVFDVKPGGELIIETDEGSITVETWEKPQVVVKVEMSGDAAELGRFKVEFNSGDSGVSVIGKEKRSRFFSWHWQSSDIRFRAKIPINYNASINTSGGDVEISGLHGNVRCETSGGDLKLSSLVGEVHGETSGGEVIIKGVNGNVRAHTSGGNVEVDSVIGSLNVETSGGEITLRNVDGKIFGETSGGSIEARLLGENKGIHLETSGGNVSIYLPKSITGDLEASTSGGTVKCDLPVMVSGKMSEDELRGKINGGGNRIELATSGGNINIRNRD